MSGDKGYEKAIVIIFKTQKYKIFHISVFPICFLFPYNDYIHLHSVNKYLSVCLSIYLSIHLLIYLSYPSRQGGII